MGGAAKTAGRVASGVFTLGGSEIARNNLGKHNILSQVLQAPGAQFTGGASGPDGIPSVFSRNDGTNPYISGPFTLDPAQYSKDQSDILSLGKQQYDDTMDALTANEAGQTKRANELFSQMLPDIAENAQAAHLYDSTGYGNEVARQEAGIASQIAADEADKRLQALSGRQGFETGALQRGQSLEDFINQANVSKTIGAQMAPQPPSGKQNFGTVASGIGALSPWGRLALGAKAATTASGGK